VSTRFTDRAAAGRVLGQQLRALHLRPPLVVLALPRGGVPVGVEVAQALQAPLDLLLVRKIGAPWQRELALAAVIEGDPPSIVIDEDVRRNMGTDADYIEAQAQVQLREIARQRQAYLSGRPAAPVEGSTVVVVDDGIATGTTMRAALKALRRRRPAALVLAVPVAPGDTLEQLRGEVDQLVCLDTPFPFHAVGEHYVRFDQVEDDEVIEALAAADRARLDRHPTCASTAMAPFTHQETRK
jgi:putative phosphoribosyl transferase